MTNANLTKAHYDLIFKNVVRRSENKEMDLNCFFEAVEEIATKLFLHTKRPVYDNILDTLDLITN